MSVALPLLASIEADDPLTENMNSAPKSARQPVAPQTTRSPRQMATTESDAESGISEFFRHIHSWPVLTWAPISIVPSEDAHQSEWVAASDKGREFISSQELLGRPSSPCRLFTHWFSVLASSTRRMWWQLDDNQGRFSWGTTGLDWVAGEPGEIVKDWYRCSYGVSWESNSPQL